MTSRAAAVLLTVAGAGALLLMGEDVGLAPGLLALAAIWLVAGRVRVVLAAVAGVLWLIALVLASSWAAVAGGVLGLTGSALTVWRGSSWPGFSAHYSRASDADQPVSPRQYWESLDRGQDPTRGPD